MKRTLLAAAMTGALTLGAAAPAMAMVYAGSQLDISNLTIKYFDETNVEFAPSNQQFTFNVEASATLNGLTASDAAACASVFNPCGTNPVLSTFAVNAPGSDFNRFDNEYSLFGPGSGTYANSNSEITDAQLAGDPATRTQQVAEAELTGSGQAQASTNIQSNTTFSIDFTIAEGVGPAQIRINFDANPEMLALVNTSGIGITQSNMTATFALAERDNGFSTNLVEWAPGGTKNITSCSGGLSCTDILDPFNLQTTLSAGPGNQTASFNPDTGAFQLYISGLTAGNYSIQLAALTSVNAAQLIPEPGTMLLLGGGLVGLGFAGLRRRQRIQAA